MSKALGNFAGPTAGTFIGQGLAGGIASAVEGGNFGSGFLAAGFGSLAGPLGLSGGQFSTGNLIESAALGGVGSVLGGGKFANGAVTGAFAYAASASYSNDNDTYKYPLSSSDQDPGPAVRAERVQSAFDALNLGNVGYGEQSCGFFSACTVFINQYKLLSPEGGPMYVDTINQAIIYQGAGYTSLGGQTFNGLFSSRMEIYAGAALNGTLGSLGRFTGFFISQFTILHELGHAHTWFGGGGFGTGQGENSADDFANQRFLK